jgi:NDP-sugar pyrophosphorylase family protein
MNFVIPMAGRGERFSRAGFSVPKMLIQAHGKTLLQWSIDSLPLHLASRMVFVGLRNHETDHNLSGLIRDLYGTSVPEILFHWLDETTRGQAQTVLACKPLVLAEEPLLIFNIDTAFRSGSLASAMLSEENDGVLGAFRSREPRFSFARIGDDGVVDKIVEKEPISDCALTGLYFCRRAHDFFRLAEEAVIRGATVNGEFYVAPILDELVASGRRFVVDWCESHRILGTPEELSVFLKSDIEASGL